MQDLKDVTNNVHYENYRSKKLAAVTCNGVDGTKNKGQLTKYENSSVFSSMLSMLLRSWITFSWDQTCKLCSLVVTNS